MKCYFFCLVFASSYAFATNDIQPNKRENSALLSGCQQTTPLTVEEIIQKRMKSSEFLASERYCLMGKEFAANNIIDEKFNYQLISKLISRYKAEYEKLDTLKDKTAFVDTFLRVASRLLIITLDAEERSGKINVVLRYKTASGALSGIALSLFQDDVVGPKFYSLLNGYTTDSATDNVNPKIYKMVLTVMYGAQGESQGNSVFFKDHNKVNGNFITISLNNEGEEECDDQCQAEAANQDYREQAEEQAEGWLDGNEGDFWWDDDDSQQWLVIVNYETGDKDEAQH